MLESLLMLCLAVLALMAIGDVIYGLAVFCGVIGQLPVSFTFRDAISNAG